MKFLSKVLLLSLAMLFLWIAGMLVGQLLFPYELPVSDATPDSSLLLMFVVCLINSTIISALIYFSTWEGSKLVLAIFITVFGVQFFMTQIETLWFNQGIQMPVNGILAILFSGALMALGVAFLGVKLIKQNSGEADDLSSLYFLPITRSLMLKILPLVLIVYPMLYFIAGYFIAWQFEALRQFYTHSTAKVSFFAQLFEGITNGLYGFQIIRAILWIVFAYLIVSFLSAHRSRNAVLIGLSFSLLFCTQLFIPNPFMPSEIALVHFLETTLSNFIWGFLAAWLIWPGTSLEAKSLKLST